jgi:beta-lactamase regulating signal transducer with metallopeptidase domain
MFWLLVNLLARSAVVLGLGGLLCRFLKSGRASQRHSLLLASLALLLMWPVLAMCLPEVNWDVWPKQATEGTVTVQQMVVGRGGERSKDGFVLSPPLVWLMVAIGSMAPLLVAHIRLRLLLRDASRSRNDRLAEEVEDLSAELELKRPPTIFVNAERIMPMTFGLWRASIVLPCDWETWTEGRRRIVLLHELAHIARRDLAAQHFARLIAACWWFQPLGWATLRMLRRESERACDERVIACGVRATQYAEELTAIAQEFAGNRSVAYAGISMARADSLERRVRLILQMPNRKAGSFTLASLFCFLAVATVAVSAVTLQPQPV